MSHICCWKRQQARSLLTHFKSHTFRSAVKNLFFFLFRPRRCTFFCEYFFLFCYKMLYRRMHIKNKASRWSNSLLYLIHDSQQCFLSLNVLLYFSDNKKNKKTVSHLHIVPWRVLQGWEKKNSKEKQKKSKPWSLTPLPLEVTVIYLLFT